jgi:murein DD-endopeptidase MepM/ murein hydrolase activator NlpD
MTWRSTFLSGVLVGAVGLAAWLRQVPQGAPAAVATSQAPAEALAARFRVAIAPGPDSTDPHLPRQPAAHTQAQASAAKVPDPVPGAQGGKLLVPVAGIKASDLTDTFDQPRGHERRHEALDIMAPAGTRVLAAGDGKVVKLFNSKAGGLTVYQFDTGEKYAYYYAHLDRYADGIKEGSMLKRGDLLGYVGSTGNADPKAPHLHFAVIALTPEKQWWKGTPVNPFPLLGD